MGIVLPCNTIEFGCVSLDILTSKMSQQTKLTSYFGKRKRFIGDESGLKAKKVLLNDNPIGHSIQAKQDKVDEPDDHCINTLIKSNIGKIKSSTEITSNKQKNVESTKKALTENDDGSKNKEKCRDKQVQDNVVPPVTFKLLGNLSPIKKKTQISNVQESNKDVPFKQNIDRLPQTPQKQKITTSNVKPVQRKELIELKDKCATDEIIKSAKDLVKRIKETQKKVTDAEQQKTRKELSLKEVKDRLKQSSKLNELKKSINKINEQAAVLIELENKKKENSVPKLSKFKALEVDVPISPQKNALYSPSKVERSPAKAAYERFNYLAEANTSLPLPFSFQKLHELFRAVDTICSMMMNRGEDITFSKLKPAVQEMTRKNFTLRHLGQMATVLPNAFDFRQEKVRNFGSTSKTDKYQLVIVPTFPGQERPNGQDDFIHLPERMSMNPKIIKARREAFYNALLDKTKDCHEEFLKSLDPPMHINRNDLKRWHPNFMVDHVPDIIPRELPSPPDNERPATAKEVLERAKDFLSSNARLQRALESASQSSDESRDITSRISPDVKEKVDSRLSNPLKGIPKSLLEKIRAKQAAKALDSMRMTPQQERETVMYTRLPAIARIVRTLFVNEQRGVLSWETVLEKVQFSYNRNLSKGEVESHVRRLVELLPEWLSVVHIRNGNYLKMNPAAELSLVMTKLDKIVTEKTKNS